jgi:hypothetical protein
VPGNRGYFNGVEALFKGAVVAAQTSQRSATLPTTTQTANRPLAGGARAVDFVERLIEIKVNVVIW